MMANFRNMMLNFRKQKGNGREAENLVDSEEDGDEGGCAPLLSSSLLLLHLKLRPRLSRTLSPTPTHMAATLALPVSNFSDDRRASKRATV